MKILIACEESQEICRAFRELGFEAYSCDLQECSGGKPEWHIVGDAIKEAYSGLFVSTHNNTRLKKFAEYGHDAQ